MYIRFTTEFINELGEQEKGVFNATLFLIEDPATADKDVAELKHIRNWFERNLNVPGKLSNATNKNPEAISLSWFKDTAKDHIKMCYDVKALLMKYGITVDVITTRTPGYVVFEDEHQVSAVPFKADKKKFL